MCQIPVSIPGDCVGMDEIVLNSVLQRSNESPRRFYHLHGMGLQSRHLVGLTSPAIARRVFALHVVHRLCPFIDWEAHQAITSWSHLSHLVAWQRLTNPECRNASSGGHASVYWCGTHAPWTALATSVLLGMIQGVQYDWVIWGTTYFPWYLPNWCKLIGVCNLGPFN